MNGTVYTYMSLSLGIKSQVEMRLLQLPRFLIEASR